MDRDETHRRADAEEAMPATKKNGEQVGAWTVTAMKRTKASG